MEEEHEEVKFVLPGSPLPSDESLETELLPPPPSPTSGMRKLSFQILKDTEKVAINSETYRSKGGFNDEKNSCDDDDRTQLINLKHDVKAATKDNPSCTGGKNVKSNVKPSTCERYYIVL